MFNKIFKLKEHNTTISKEVIAGFITFLTTLYIIFVNPIILSAAGMEVNQVFISTCITIFLACMMLAFITNLPLMIGPGMGLNAIFVYDIVIANGYSYHAALLTVFLAGVATFVVFLIIPAKVLVNSIPKSLRSGIIAGTGIFLILIGLKLSGIVIPNKNTFVALGNTTSISVLFSFLFFIVLFICYSKNINYFPIVIFALAAAINMALANTKGEFSTILNTLTFSGYHIPFFALDFSNFKLPLIGVIVTLFFAGNFDSIGSYLSYNAIKAPSSIKTEEKLLKKLLLIKGVSSMFSGVLGSSTMTIFLESNAGIKSGGKTGLVALTVGTLFLLALFLKPLLGVVPAWGSGPILLTVGAFMLISGLKNLEWQEYTEYLPAVLAVLFIPLTYSITNGIAIGIISYILVKTLSGKYKDISLLSFILALVFLIYLLT